MAYPNGQIPRHALKQIVPTQYDYDLRGPAMMLPEPAVAMSAMLVEARADGRPFNVKYSYRPLHVQWQKWRTYLNGGNLAAYPGTSNHGEGRSADLTNIGESDIYWLRNNARAFGFVNDVPSEVWHWTYYGGFDPGRSDDVALEQYIEGEQAYRRRYKEREQNKPNQDPDPGPPPPEWGRFKKAGWNSARFSANNPRRRA